MGKITHKSLDFIAAGTYPAIVLEFWKVGVSRRDRMITQVEIARRVGLDVSSVNKILNRRQGPVFRKDTIKRVFRVARDLGYDFGRLKYQHRRRHPRKEMSVGAELCIYHKDGTVYDQGVA